jgi:phage baseplate assembly protein W
MIKKQYFGIKYPFTSTDIENYFVDLNSSKKNKVRSQIMHVIFTPKGQRVRMPEFGTDLIKYIFEPNESNTWKSVKTEISEAVSRYVNNVSLNDIQVARSEENPNAIFVRIDYSVKEGNVITNDSIVTEI